MGRFAQIASGVFLALLLPLMMAFAFEHGLNRSTCAPVEIAGR